jgi:hypothetical protein
MLGRCWRGAGRTAHPITRPLRAGPGITAAGRAGRASDPPQAGSGPCHTQSGISLRFASKRQVLRSRTGNPTRPTPRPGRGLENLNLKNGPLPEDPLLPPSAPRQAARTALAGPGDGEASVGGPTVEAAQPEAPPSPPSSRLAERSLLAHPNTPTHHATPSRMRDAAIACHGEWKAGLLKR